MKRFLCMLACLMLLCSGAMAELLTASTPVPTEESDFSDLDAKFDAIFKSYKTVGCSVVVAKDGKIVYQRNYGYAYKKGNELVDDDTCFRIASVTKMVSGIHIMQLVEQGKLALDEDISTYLGYEIVNPYAKNTPITLRTLMSHTSSLNSSAGYSNEKNTLKDLLAKSSKKSNNFKKYAPGSKYEYSNFGAGIMGSLMEATTGIDINASVTKDLFAPLGIDAAYNPNLLQHPEKIACIYRAGGKMFKGRITLTSEQWDTSINPDKHFRTTVGCLWIKPRDLCRLGIMMCEGGTVDGVTVLQPETVEEMCASQLGRGVVTVDSPYGLCVNRIDNLLDDRMIYGHQGLIDDNVANLYFDPQSGFVFCFVSNGCSTKKTDRICTISRKAFQLAWDTFGE